MKVVSTESKLNFSNDYYDIDIFDINDFADLNLHVSNRNIKQKKRNINDFNNLNMHINLKSNITYLEEFNSEMLNENELI